MMQFMRAVQLLCAALLLAVGCAAPRPRIAIDGRFEDWAAVPEHTDPEGDTHDTDHHGRHDRPDPVDHPDVDLLAYRVTHDAENLYFYFRARGQICRTARKGPGRAAGRYYAIVTIDADDSERTGYWLHEGGFYPTSNGYDLNAEVEYHDGTFNTGHYINHGARDAAERLQALRDQSAGQYRPGNPGPYPSGHLRLLPGTYAHYSQWVMHRDGRITFVADKGPVVRGIITAAISPDGHQLEMKVPLRGFMVDERGRAILVSGQRLKLSFSLEASGELAPGRRWASDTGAPIHYALSPR